MDIQKISIGDMFVKIGDGSLKIEASFINYITGYMEFGSHGHRSFDGLKSNFRKL
tara:strand:- start:12705 stop:12869 length:165 start_codon:yes stop_codon:yes gene_type:complete